MKTFCAAVVLLGVALSTFSASGMPPAEVADYAARLAHSHLVIVADCRLAIELYSIAIRLDPNRASAYSGRSRAYLGLLATYGTPLKDFNRFAGTPDFDASLADLTELIRLCSVPQDKAQTYCDRGKVYMLKKNGMQPSKTIRRPSSFHPNLFWHWSDEATP